MWNYFILLGPTITQSLIYKTVYTFLKYIKLLSPHCNIGYGQYVVLIKLKSTYRVDWCPVIISAICTISKVKIRMSGCHQFATFNFKPELSYHYCSNIINFYTYIGLYFSRNIRTGMYNGRVKLKERKVSTIKQLKGLKEIG